MIAQEREFLKARANLDRLIEIVQQAGKEHTRVDEVERSIFTELLSTGFHLISAFVAAAGDGDHARKIGVEFLERTCVLVYRPSGYEPDKILARLCFPATYVCVGLPDSLVFFGSLFPGGLANGSGIATRKALRWHQHYISSIYSFLES